VIEENVLKTITTREYEAASLLEKLSNSYDPIEDILNFDYTSSRQAFPLKFSLDINTLLPTGISYSYLNRPLAGQTKVY
jgi:hypothetical protein